MSPWWQAMLAIGCVMVIYMVVEHVRGVLAARRRRAERQDAEGAEASWLRDEAADILLNARDGQPRRYEIAISDWGVERGPMRYRWAVWDADRHLVIAADPDADSIGLEVPFMLGNAPTAPMAEAEALAWVHKQGADNVVVSHLD